MYVLLDIYYGILSATTPKEVSQMQITTTARHASPYPNAATWRYHLDRLVEGILCAAICLGLVAIVFFLCTMS